LDPRNYSATGVLLFGIIYKPLFTKTFSRSLSIRTTSSSLKSKKFRIKNVYGVAKFVAEDRDSGYPINSFAAKNNRESIKEWIQHAKYNGYNLIFADIDTQFFNHQSERLTPIPKVKDRQFYCEFIKQQGSKCFSFVNYLDDIGIKNWNVVRYKRDGHLNFKGNQLYSDFLVKIYKGI
tara:strand:- start:32 stop:565 length:534 start_codon:yes stop_codon:yes gene_type:complete